MRTHRSKSPSYQSSINSTSSTSSTPENSANTNFGHLYKEISSRTLFIIGTYTISFGAFVSSWALSKTPSPDDNLPEFLAAASMIPTYFNTVIVLSLSPQYGIPAVVNPLYSLLLATSKNDIDKINNIKQAIAVTNRTSIYIATLMSIPAAFSFYYSKEILITLLQNGVMADYASQFLKPWTAGTLPMLLRIGFEQNLFPRKKAMLVTIIDLAIFALSTATAVYLRIGLNSSISSIAWCYVTEAWLTMFINAAILAGGFCCCEDTQLRNDQFFKLWGYGREAIQGVECKAVKHALPSFLNTLTDISASYAVNLSIGSFSTIAQAALSAPLIVFNLVLMAIVASGVSAAQTLGQLAANITTTQVIKIVLAAMSSLASFVCPIAVLMLFYPQAITTIFSSPLLLNSSQTNTSTSLPFTNSTLEQETQLMTRLMAPVCVFEALRYLLVSLFRSLQQTWTGFAASILPLCLVLIAGIIYGSAEQNALFNISSWSSGAFLAGATLLSFLMCKTGSYLSALQNDTNEAPRRPRNYRVRSRRRIRSRSISSHGFIDKPETENSMSEGLLSPLSEYGK